MAINSSVYLILLLVCFVGFARGDDDDDDDRGGADGPGLREIVLHQAQDIGTLLEDVKVLLEGRQRDTLSAGYILSGLGVNGGGMDRGGVHGGCSYGTSGLTTMYVAGEPITVSHVIYPTIHLSSVMQVRHPVHMY